MSNWVRFSDRMPTEADADHKGEVIMQRDEVRRLMSPKLISGTSESASRHTINLHVGKVGLLLREMKEILEEVDK